MNLNLATKIAVVRLADPVLKGAGSMVRGAKDEALITHRGTKQHRNAYGGWSNPGALWALHWPHKDKWSTTGQCKKRQEEGTIMSDGLRFSDEAANPRQAKRSTSGESCQAVMDIMQRTKIP